MQRAAWSRVSFSLSGMTNSRKLFTRSATGSYLRSRRSISRKPVILPIKAEVPASSYLSFRDAPKAQTRNLDVVSRDSGFALRAPRNDACSVPLILRSGVFAASRRMRPHRGLMVRDGARAPPHHEDKNYAPIAIFGSASALAFISFRARRYSTGITLRNFGSHVFQFARISAAFFEPASLAWRVIRTCSRSTSE